MDIKDTCDEFDVKHWFSEEEQELTLLSEMVRERYLSYLEKQLLENVKNCHPKGNCQYESSVKLTAKILEDKAIEACKIAQYYQRAMVKIIAIVRRSTQENRLITQLQNSISNLQRTESRNATKETQTEAGLLFTGKTETKPNISTQVNHYDRNESSSNDENPHELTLDEKIEIFQKHLKNGYNTNIVGRSQHNKNERTDYKSKRNQTQKINHKKIHTKKERHDNPQQHHRHHHHRPYKESCRPDIDNSSEDSVITSMKSPVVPPPSTSNPPKHEVLAKSINIVVADMENSNDSVALELARLFSEEKTELDEIFGIDPNQEPDDPQICKILKEIEQANVNGEPQNPHNSFSNNVADELKNSPKIVNKQELNPINPITPKNAAVFKATCVDLSKSMWPCELFMQKRKLSEVLARLIEEDLRWHDIIKWKFYELFGEDSDDEFMPWSPSIELDEIVMGSCVKRISPWIVKHLMKPMRDGLIGNRFIFKKLAKHIARSIIMENQYPDEAIIKGCVENYFCLHQAVMTLDDLQDVPSISLV